VDTSLGPIIRIGTMLFETDEEYLAVIFLLLDGEE
jgi:hypothetical protein